MGVQMQTSQVQSDSLLESVPPPDQVRERLVENAREGRLLRSLYKLSQRIFETREREASTDED